MRIFYDTENDEFISLDFLRSLYEEFGKGDYETFADYVMACQTFNNGTLTAYRDNIGREYVERHSGKQYSLEEAIAELSIEFSWTDEVELNEELNNLFNHFEEWKVKSDRDF